LFEASLRLLHPVMPFITEEIWQAVYDGKSPLKSIALAEYPCADESQIDLAAETNMAIVQDLIVSVRNLRADLKVEPKVRVDVEVYAEPEIRKLIESNSSALERLGNVGQLTFASGPLANLQASRSTARFDVHLIYEQKIDVAAECGRLKKELDKFEKEMNGARQQLGNESFIAKAPAEVVEGRRARLAELEVLAQKTKNKLVELNC